MGKTTNLFPHNLKPAAWDWSRQRCRAAGISCAPIECADQLNVLLDGG
jgi:hypothetical protein